MSRPAPSRIGSASTTEMVLRLVPCPARAWDRVPRPPASGRAPDRPRTPRSYPLKETADWLSGQNEPDIDQLVPKVETAMKAYSICKDRLDKVQATLGQYFPRDSPAGEQAPPPNVNGDGQARNPNR